MRFRLGIAMLAAVIAYCLFVGWKFARTPALPPRPQPQLADLGTIKADLFAFARAERAYYAAAGRYAPLSELRSEGLLSLPPDIRWPYFYTIHMPAPNRFVIMAVAEGPFGARPIAITIDDDFNMRRFDSHHWRPGRRRNRGAARQNFS